MEIDGFFYFMHDFSDFICLVLVYHGLMVCYSVRWSWYVLEMIGCENFWFGVKISRLGFQLTPVLSDSIQLG